MKVSEEMAVRLHRIMWEDMQKELGDNPAPDHRMDFKRDWVNRMFPDERVTNVCWLCHYTATNSDGSNDIVKCSRCPINWPEGHCNSSTFSYLKMPISEILALPKKNESIAKKAANLHDLSRDIVVGEVAKASGLPVECDIWSHIKVIQEKVKENAVAGSYYQYREELLSKASGIPAICAIDDHVKEIQKKAVQQSTFSQMYCDAKTELAKASGLPAADSITDHIKAIQEKAVDDYFAKMPLAKAITTDVDDAFKQYADEQKAPIFRALAEASGLSAHNESVKAHISRIKEIVKQSGRLERSEEIFKALTVYSGVSAGNWSVYDHVQAIQEKASNKKDMEILRKTSMQLADKVDRYKNALSKESDLDRNRPVDDHIREIVRNSMEAGATEEQERIMHRIGELLNHDFDFD